MRNESAKTLDDNHASGVINNSRLDLLMIKVHEDTLVSRQNAEVYYKANNIDKNVYDFVLPNGSIIPCLRPVYVLLKRILIAQ